MPFDAENTWICSTIVLFKETRLLLSNFSGECMRKKRTGFIQSLENAICLSCSFVLSGARGVYLRIYTSLMNCNNSRIACYVYVLL